MNTATTATALHASRHGDHALPKAEQTRLAIIGQALRMARKEGIGSLTLGPLADQLKMSKTGVFARVGSKAALQMAVVQAYRSHFRLRVVDPGHAAPAGLPRLRAMFGFWARHVAATHEGACLYISCATEFANQPGPIHDALASDAQAWRAALEACARQAVEHGHLRSDTDVTQLACDMSGLILVLHHHTRLLGDSQAVQRSAQAFERLLSACAVR